MNKDTKVKIQDIANSPLFIGVPSSQLKNILKFCILKEYCPGSAIVNEGDRGDFMFIIVEGQVSVIKGPKKLKLATLGKGVFLGEEALIGKAARNASVIANDHVKIAMLDQRAFDKLITLHPCIPVTMMNMHSERCKDTVRKMNIMKSKDFIFLAAIAGLLALRSSHSVLPANLSGLSTQIATLIPDQLITFGGPVMVAFGLKLKQMELGSILSKLDKI